MDSPDTRAAAIAARQHGVVSHRQLRAAGASSSTISRWVEAGRLRRLRQGVYAFGHAALTQDGWWHAAALAAGPGGAIVARAACEIWRLLALRYEPIDVIPDHRLTATVPWLRVHRMPLAEEEVRVRRGLRVTTVERAIVDLAESAPAHDVASALDQALLLRLVDRRELERAVANARGRHGLQRLLPAIARLSEHGETLLSTTERRVRDVLVDRGLPRPEVNRRVLLRSGYRYRPDLLWPDIGLIVEIDGPQHRMPYQQELDRERDARFGQEGYRVLRFPVEQVDDEIDAVVACLRHILQTSSTWFPRGGNQVDDAAA